MALSPAVRHLRNLVNEAEKALTMLQFLGIPKASIALHILEGIEKTVQTLYHAIENDHTPASAADHKALGELVKEIAAAKLKALAKH